MAAHGLQPMPLFEPKADPTNQGVSQKRKVLSVERKLGKIFLAG